MGLSTNPNCNNCNQEGTLIHTYWECYPENNLCRKRFDWIHTKSGTVLTPSGMKCLLNRYECNCIKLENSDVLNLLCFLTCHFIHC